MSPDSGLARDRAYGDALLWYDEFEPKIQPERPAVPANDTIRRGCRPRRRIRSAFGAGCTACCNIVRSNRRCVGMRHLQKGRAKMTRVKGATARATKPKP